MANLYSPSLLVTIDTNDVRLAIAKNLGAQHRINSMVIDAAEAVRLRQNREGCDAVIEALEVPATFEPCQKLVQAEKIVIVTRSRQVSIELIAEALLML
jgi:alcohol dehydrogenase